jgi:hypothetical protein
MPLVILAEATVADLGKSERALEYAKSTFQLKPDASLGRVLTLGLFVYIALVFDRRLVISCAAGAASRITSPWP